MMSTTPPDAHPDTESRTMFDGLAPDDTIRLTLFSSGESPEHSEGELILGNQIGRGGVGEVYEAIQPNLNRTVAVKVLLNTQKKSLPQMFQNEAYITARLNHPNILPVHDMVLVDGVPALIMKRVYGRSWEEQILDTRHDGSFRLEPNIRTLINVCRAVDYAHAQGVLHLDLKPANVMVGEFGETLVMDWGCATIFEDTRWAKDDHLPRTHAIKKPVGTPRFLSPEQARGNGNEIGPHSDVFLLGAILRMLLTEAPLRSGTTADEMILEAASALPAPLPDRGPIDLISLCKDALHVDPDRRIESVQAFRDGLENWLDERESRALIAQAQKHFHALSATHSEWTMEDRQSMIQTLGLFEQAARLPGAKDRAQKGANETRVLLAEHALHAKEPGFARSFIEQLPSDHHQRAPLLTEMNKQLTALTKQRRTHLRFRWIIATTMVILVAAFVGTMGLYLESEQSRRSAEMAQEEAEAVMAFSARMLEAVDPEIAKGLDTNLVEKMLETAVFNAHTEFANRPRPLAAVLKQVANGRFSLGQYQESAEIQHRAVELMRTTFGPDSKEFLQASYNQATNLFRMGKYDRANEMLRECINKSAMWPVVQADCLHTLSQVLMNQDDLDEGLRLVNRALEIETKESGLVSLNKIRMLNSRSQIYAQQNELELAAKDIEGVVQARINLLGADHYETSTAYLNLGVVRRKQDRLEEAISLYQNTLEIRSQLLDANHPKILTIHNNMGTAYRSGGATDRAIESLKLSFEGRISALGKEHLYTSMTAAMLADELTSADRLDEAEKLYRDYGMLDPNWSAPHALFEAIVTSGVANFLMAKQEWNEASKRLDRLANFEAIQNSESMLNWVTFRSLYVQQMQGDSPSVDTLLELVVANAKDRGSAHCTTLNATRMATDVLHLQGQEQMALEYRDRMIGEAKAVLTGPTPPGTFADASENCIAHLANHVPSQR